MKISSLLGPILPATCAGCNEPGPTLCRRCRFSLATAVSPEPTQHVRAAFAFEGTGRQVLLALKYHNRRSVARVLASHIVRRVRVPQVDLVTWAPTAMHRSQRRGFDQAELLARAIAHELGVPCRRLLYRTHGQAQTGLSRNERLVGPGFRTRHVRSGLRVLLVDDVVTTGATIGAARASLLDAGISEVYCIAAAATPAPGSALPTAAYRPVKRRTSATAAVGSSSTTMPVIPKRAAASTLVAMSSRKMAASADTPNLSKAS
jgi:ComF family protein